MPEKTIYTVGHSTRSHAELVAILRVAAIEQLVDVRTAPRSRRHSDFNREALRARLPAQGIAYAHEPRLGGFRRPASNSPNGGWEHPAFRGYADHMTSAEFAAGLAELESTAAARPTAIMCAEAQWWRCHRRLIADALTVRGWHVRHLGLRPDPADAPAHKLTPFVVVGQQGALRYPPPQGQLSV